MVLVDLKPRQTVGARVESIENGWRLCLDEGNAKNYRLAQLDNYSTLTRSKFPNRPPFQIQLKAQASQAVMPGTWGFGLWNDPFGFSLGLGSTPGRLPALPNAAWFFFASHENYLSLNDDLPGSGAMAAVYKSPRFPAITLMPALLALPLLALQPAARWARRQATRFIKQQAASLQIDPTGWHEYKLDWQEQTVQFWIDGKVVLNSRLSPRGPLALVLWVDNQYAAWRPNGKLAYGTLATPRDCWVEIANIEEASR